MRVRVHVKIDTGMSRVGLFYQEAGRDDGIIDEVEAIVRLPGLEPEGIFTHFASADEEDEDGDAYTRRQFTLFMDAVEKLERRGIRFPLRHCCNSAGVLRYPDMHLDLVRPGIILYGLAPDGWMEGMLPLKPAMELKTVISMVKTIPAGAKVSYGRRFTADRAARIATVPIGYADGYSRSLSNRADMLVGGRRARVVGRVCMDQCMLDVTDIPAAREGMTVTVFGRDGRRCCRRRNSRRCPEPSIMKPSALSASGFPGSFSAAAGRWGDSIISCRNDKKGRDGHGRLSTHRPAAGYRGSRGGDGPLFRICQRLCVRGREA